MPYTHQKDRPRTQSPRQLSHSQRSHLLLILSNSKPNKSVAFIDWASGDLRENIANSKQVLSIKLMEKHAIDVTEGAYQEIPYHYLFIVELNLDGACQANLLIDSIFKWYSQEASAVPPTTWLYYPVCEKVGRCADKRHLMLTLAFANPLPGREAEFREWYATQHIRHALNVPQLVSGQCFESTCYQHTGVSTIDYKMIAMYEQEGTPEEMIKSFAELSEDALDFPSLDLINFAEWVYQPLKSIPAT